MFKRQQFKDNESNKTKSKRSKYQRLDKHDNEGKNGLNEDKDKLEGIKYVFPPFISLFLLQKVLNQLSNQGKRRKKLNHFIYLSKICYSRSVKFALEFLSRRSLKAPKKNLY